MLAISPRREVAAGQRPRARPGPGARANATSLPRQLVQVPTGEAGGGASRAASTSHEGTAGPRGFGGWALAAARHRRSTVAAGRPAQVLDKRKWC